MRVSCSLVLMSAAALALGACDRSAGTAPDDAAEGATPAAADAPAVTGAAPIIRAGFWSVETTDEGVATTSTMCIDEAVQQRMSVFGSSLTAAWCGNTTISRRALGGWTSHADCSPLEGTDMDIDMTITGDMRSRFRNEMVITTNGEAEAPTISEGRYVGPCPAGMVPGDIVDENGETANMLELAAGMEAMGQMMKGMRGGG